ncbi:hypothetical protein N8J89_38710 [Crossiella sp. CA-258035]|uniref:hypothetical protein n=1 Tax=Crossiella sp. CA-258035 TaxID=2981138 RepID=UPI0024BC7FF8|nr:hypothetical protein [Crossiella sp. CA-258035]WHT18968.1 hypothetical protein N8J89_38710 [Crossiella sp. CA-258035]
MNAPEQDLVESRLRVELTTARLGPELRAGQVDEVIKACRRRRSEQRRQRVALLAVVATVVLTTAGLWSVLGGAPAPERVTAAAPVGQWPARGELAGDRDLSRRAEQVWRQAGRGIAQADRVHLLFAQASTGLRRNVLVVALSASGPDGRTRVAFVTSALTARPPDREHLLLRAVAEVKPEASAIGFAAAQPDQRDEPAAEGEVLAFALAAPGKDGLGFTTSAVDHELTDGNRSADDAIWAVLPAGAGAWNTRLTLSSGSTRTTEPLAAGTADPAVQAGTLEALTGPGTARIRPERGNPVAIGDLVAGPTGLVGVVSAAEGDTATVDTGLTSLPPGSRVQVAISGLPGSLRPGARGELLFEPGGGAEPAAGNRVVLTDPARPGLLVNLGRLAGGAGAWRVDRLAEPDPGGTVVIISGRR